MLSRVADPRPETGQDRAEQQCNDVTGRIIRRLKKTCHLVALELARQRGLRGEQRRLRAVDEVRALRTLQR